MSNSNVFERYVEPLGADGVYTSPWQDMSGFQAICGMVTGDEIINEAKFEWSDDQVHLRLAQPWIKQENPLSYGGTMSAATPTQARFVRLVVENGPNAQGPDWASMITLLVEPPTGYVSPLVDFPEDNDPGQTVKAVLFGRRLGDVDPQYTQVLVDGGGEIIVSEGPLPTTEFDQRIPATLDSTQVTSFAPELRRSLSIYNSSTVGNLYIRLGEDVDVALGEWSWKVLPGWTWIAPQWGGDVYIAWDEDTDGFAHCSEVTG